MINYSVVQLQSFFVVCPHFLFSTPTFSLSTPMENSEDTWQTATKCNKYTMYMYYCIMTTVLLSQWYVDLIEKT